MSLTAGSEPGGAGYWEVCAASPLLFELRRRLSADFWTGSVALYGAALAVALPESRWLIRSGVNRVSGERQAVQTESWAQRLTPAKKISRTRYACIIRVQLLGDSATTAPGDMHAASSPDCTWTGSELEATNSVQRLLGDARALQ